MEESVLLATTLKVPVVNGTRGNWGLQIVGSNYMLVRERSLQGDEGNGGSTGVKQALRGELPTRKGDGDVVL